MIQTRSVRVGLVIVAFGLLAAGVARPAAGAEKGTTGTWNFFVGPRPPDGRLSKLVLKQDGDKLTGKVTLPGGMSQEIQDGKVTGDKISFWVQFRPNTPKFHHSGEVVGDTIKGKTEREPPGEPKRAHFDWQAERIAD